MFGQVQNKIETVAMKVETRPGCPQIVRWFYAKSIEHSSTIVPINALTVGNFKGLSTRQTIAIKPLTIFVGPNSSGKSSCIHAMAALAQTVKLAGDPRPLILDDEFAQVHLGRFIEVVHSRSYSDSIELGIDIGPVPYSVIEGNRMRPNRVGLGKACYSFKSTKRTQDTYLADASLILGDQEFNVKKVGKSYQLSPAVAGIEQVVSRRTGLQLDFEPKFSRGPSSPGDFNKYNIVQQLQARILRELRRVVYLGPFRQSPLRRYPTRGATPTEVGAQGEATITLLANEIVQKSSRTHIKQIAKWLKMMDLAKDIDVSRVATSDLFDVNLTLQDDVSLPIADLGYGLSQVLPVLAQCAFAPDQATLLFEQPELHLHPLAARPLAKVFIQTSHERHSHVVLETHSPQLVYEFITELRAGNIERDEIVVYEVARADGRTQLKELDIDDKTFDVYTNWEKGFSKPV